MASSRMLEPPSSPVPSTPAIRIKTPTHQETGPFPDRFQSQSPQPTFHEKRGIAHSIANSQVKDDQGRSFSTAAESRFYPFSDVDIPFYVNEVPQDWSAFDKLSEDADRENIETLKGVLDSLLIFAALFSAVNAAILAFTLPLMTGGSPDRQNELLEAILERQIASSSSAATPATTEGGGEVSAAEEGSTGVPPFNPPEAFFTTNLYISMSLTLALIAAFICVLGQQWLIYYKVRGIAGADKQRWDQQRRTLGARRWRVDYIIKGLLPVALHISVIFFLVGFATFLHHVRPWIGWPTVEICCIGAAFFFITSFASVWDPYSPFRTPYSSPFRMLFKLFGRIISVGAFLLCGGRKVDFSPFLNFASKFQRKPESTVVLQAGAICWILETTGKDEALHAAAWNITTIEDQKALKLIYGRESRRTLLQMWQAATDSLLETTLITSGREPREADQRIHLADAAAYSQADAHLVLSVGSVDDWFPNLHSLPVIAMDRGNQRTLIWRAALAQVVDYSSPNNVHPKLRPRYIGMCSVALLYHRLYSDARNEDQNGDGGEQLLRSFAFEALTQQQSSSQNIKSAAIVAWALSAILRPWPDRQAVNISASVAEFREDFKDLQQVYSSGGSSEAVQYLAAALETFVSRHRPNTYGLPMPPNAAYAGLLGHINDAYGLPFSAHGSRLIIAICTVLDVVRSDEDDSIRTEALELLPKVLDACSASGAMKGWDDRTVADVGRALKAVKGLGGDRLSKSVVGFGDLMGKVAGGKMPEDVKAEVRGVVEEARGKTGRVSEKS